MNLTVSCKTKQNSRVSFNSASETTDIFCKTVFSNRRDPVIFSVGFFFLFSDFFVEMALNAEQAEALQIVLAGHNLVITGQAGVGKSRLVASIVKNCEIRNLKFAVVCSSGIACTVYGGGRPFCQPNLFWRDQWPRSAS